MKQTGRICFMSRLQMYEMQSTCHMAQHDYTNMFIHSIKLKQYFSLGTNSDIRFEFQFKFGVAKRVAMAHRRLPAVEIWARAGHKA